MVKEKILLGCFENKEKEYKQYLRDIIIKNTNDDTIFVEPFCGSAIISKKLHDEGHIKQFHINDIDTYRIDFYNNMKNKKKREELYKQKQKSKEKKKRNTLHKLLKFCLRYGLFPTTKNIVVTPIGENWAKFLNTAKITNQDYKDVMEIDKDNEIGFIYIDPPCLDSYNANYSWFLIF